MRAGAEGDAVLQLTEEALASHLRQLGIHVAHRPPGGLVAAAGRVSGAPLRRAMDWTGARSPR
jgi:hypothetical protein